MSSQYLRALGKLGSSSLVGNSRGNSTALLLRTQKKVPVLQLSPCAFISTSKKDRETIAADTAPTKSDHDPTTVTGTKKKYWTSMGFDYFDEDRDRNYTNQIMFTTVTLGLVLTSFILAYWPDHRLRDWSQREAYIEIARREALGLPHVDPNLVPVDRINLPSEEELEDFDVIV